jgi:arginine decarboxylase
LQKNKILSAPHIRNRYTDLIHQTFFFPRHGFEVVDNQLFFHGIDLMALVKEYGSPLKFTYLPKIESQISKAKELFASAIEKYEYNGSYNYCYCTKSSHFSFILNEVLKCNVDLETS